MFGLFKKKKPEIMLRYDGEDYAYNPSETILDCLERHELNPPFSCRTGICHSCKMRVVKGNVPSIATDGLSDKDKANGFFLPCVCQSKENLEVADLAADLYDVKVLKHEKMNARTWKLRLSRPDKFHYRAGQFLNIHAHDLVRSYSLASLPSEDFLELHVMQMPEGNMSVRLCQQLQVGDTLHITEATGLCCYHSSYSNQPLLLAGTGTGLAPLYGIAKDALEQGHQAGIYLYHGSLVQKDLYLMRELNRLSDIYEHFHYMPCVLREAAPDSGGMQGQLEDILIQQHADLTHYRIFLCGNPEMIQAMQNKCLSAGASSAAILVDAFA